MLLPKMAMKGWLSSIVLGLLPTSRTPLKMIDMRGKRQPSRAALITPNSTRYQSGRLSASNSRNLIWSSSSTSSSSELLLDRCSSAKTLLLLFLRFLPISISTSSSSAVNCTVLVVPSLSGDKDDRFGLTMRVPRLVGMTTSSYNSHQQHTRTTQHISVTKGESSCAKQVCKDTTLVQHTRGPKYALASGVTIS